MISNREDKQILTEFFRAIEQRAGKINPQWFMTDDAEQFYNAWIEVFGEQDIKKKFMHMACRSSMEKSTASAHP